MTEQAKAKLIGIEARVKDATSEDDIDYAHWQVEKLIKEENLVGEQANLVLARTATEGVEARLKEQGIVESKAKVQDMINQLYLKGEELKIKASDVKTKAIANKLRGLEGKANLSKIEQEWSRIMAARS